MFVSRSLKSRLSVAEHPQRAQQRGGGGDRHAHGGGEILGRVPRGHQVVVIQDHGVAQQGFEIGHGALQRPGGAVSRSNGNPHELRSFNSVVASSRR